MTTLTPVYRIPQNSGASGDEGPFETFFVPQFQVKISGEELPPEIVRDVIQVTYRDSLAEIDSFDLLISNYESDFSQALQGVRAKYEPPSRPEYEGRFDPGQQVEVYMGYAGRLHLMLTGEILAIEPNYPASGGLTVSVRGLNVLHRFRASQHTYAWEETRDSDIAVEIGRNPLREDRPGLDFTVRIDPTARQSEVPDRYVSMISSYDILFLLERARRRDYELVLRETDERGNPDPHLYFGPSNDTQAPTYQLEWGRSLVSFRPTLSTARQVSEVVVLGWDRERNARIEGRASWEDCLQTRDPQERQRLTQLAQAFGSRREVITDQPVHNEQEATDRARRILCDIQKGMVEASGETIGLPDLRAGRKVQIENLGDRFSGLYYVTETTHTIGDGGYRTTFKARREEGLNR